MITVLVVDDQELVRAGLSAILADQLDLQVVGQAGTADEAVASVVERVPDVVVMDLRMPGMDGSEATRRIEASGASAKFLVLTTFDADDDVVAALHAGASWLPAQGCPSRSAHQGCAWNLRR